MAAKRRRRSSAFALAAAGIATGLALVLAPIAAAAGSTLTLSAGGATVGSPIEATAHLTEAPGAEGEIEFEVFGPDDPTCSEPALKPAPPTAMVIGEGNYSTQFTAKKAGTYNWSAHYTGDDVNPPAEALCAAASGVAKAKPSLAGTATSATIGASITDNVTLSGGFEPKGELVFRAYDPADGSCSMTPAYGPISVEVSANGAYAPPGFTPATPGLYRWKVEYEGDGNNEAVTLGCGAANQTSTVSKAKPGLAGTATSALLFGSITDNVTLSGGYETKGELVFKAYGPDDTTCATPPAYEPAPVPVEGDGPYAPPAFTPAAPGAYRWTVEYKGDENNEKVALGCNAPNQTSAVGTLPVTLTAAGTGGTVGGAVTAQATLTGDANPGGQITFAAFAPDDVSCSGAPAFVSTVSATGAGTYASAAFTTTQAGAFRWTVAYSGDPNHSPADSPCGAATSNVAQAAPAIVGNVRRQATVGRRFRMTARLVGAYLPGGTVTFKVFGPGQNGCSKPLALDTVPASADGVVKSDPFAAPRPGRYRFVAEYSGDAANLAAVQPCETTGQVVQVEKASPKLKPRARLKRNRRRISIRARLSGAASPKGVIFFRLYRPGDRGCARRPAFSGGISVKSNGNYLLAEYLAPRRGVYRLVVAYSGDRRNRPYPANCRAAQRIRAR